MKILDFYVHQGHQYEFFKTGYQFDLTTTSFATPKWNELHRPLNKNVSLVKREELTKYDVVMFRSSISYDKIEPFIKQGAIPVAVVQVANNFSIHKNIKHVVWNSFDVMNKYKHTHPDKKHYYIVHGFDPNEFVFKNEKRNKEVLSVINVFKKRGDILGFELWDYINKKTKCKIVGHGNEDLSSAIKEASSFDELINFYNSYGLYLNTTVRSAMPRSRGEATMCGMPLVSTKNYDIGMYFKHGENALLSNDKIELAKYCREVLTSDSLAESLSVKARETAVKHFHIKDYLEKWNEVFSSL